MQERKEIEAKNEKKYKHTIYQIQLWLPWVEIIFIKLP